MAQIDQMKEAGKLHYNPNAPEGGEDLGKDFWEKAYVEGPKVEPKSVHLKLDPEVFEFFKRQGKGHLTKMQEVLKSYVKAHQP